MVSQINVSILNEFEEWFEYEMQKFFNLISNILATSEESKKNKISTIFSRNNKLINSNELKHFKINYWYCLKEHKLPSCAKFISLILDHSKDFVKRKSSWNCLANEHKNVRTVLPLSDVVSNPVVRNILSSRIHPIRKISQMSQL